MYKKITHHITEEHFGHPVATQIKKVVDKTTTNTSPGVKPKAVNMQSQSAFKAAVQNYFSNFQAQMNQIINSVNGPEQSLIQAEDGIFSNIDSLGNLLKQYYGSEVGERINSSNRDLALGMVSILRSLREGADYKTTLNGRMSTLVANEYGSVLNKVNNMWVWNDIKGRLINLVNTWVEQIKAVQNKDTNAANLAQTKATTIINDFAKTLSEGVVAQFTDVFTAP